MQKYHRIKKISQGAFGTVYQYKTIDPNQKIPNRVAIKQIFSSSNIVKRQLQILKDLPPHKNIIKIYEIIEDKFNVFIVMQLCKYDLYTLIQQISYPIKEIQIKKIAYQILNGLKVLHEKQYIHRDLKPSNVIINEKGKIQLCDFGSAVKCTQGEQYEVQGFTRWYKAPEMLYGSRNYKYQVDVWSLGCILMEFATGQPYFDGKSEIQQLSLITKELGNPTQQNWPSFSKLPDFGKINFKQMSQKTQEQIAKQRGISIQLSKFIKKMIKYDNRATVMQLLKDSYLSEISDDNQLLDMPSSQSQNLRNQIKLSLDKLKKEVKSIIKNC